MPPRPTRCNGVHAQIERLGLRTYNNTGNEHKATRPVFKYEPVSRLYHDEVQSFFGLLCLHDGSVLSREDPTLFDEDLDDVLQEYGPLIWPQPVDGSREHLREAQAGSLYESDLIYPRDVDTLKIRLRGLILAKFVKPGTDVQAIIHTKHKDWHMSLPKTATSSAPAAAAHTRPMGFSKPSARRTRSVCYDSVEGDSESEDSVIGTTTRRRALVGATTTHTGFSSVELRLYRKTSTTLPGAYGPVKPYGPWFLTTDCTTAHDCFTRICEKIETDCSFVVFHLPEDMSFDRSVRVNRGSGDAESTFRRVLEIFRSAKEFPGEPGYRSVEVEVGLDLPADDDQ